MKEFDCNLHSCPCKILTEISARISASFWPARLPNSRKYEKEDLIIATRASLKVRMTERQNDGMAESRNGGKSPQILKDRITEQRKIPPNPKRRNHGIM